MAPPAHPPALPASGLRRAAARTWLFTAAVVAVVAGVTSLNIWSDYDEVLEEGQRDSLNIARSVAAHAEQGIGNIARNLDSINDVVNHWPSGSRPAPAQVDWLIRGRARISADVRAIFILDADGMLTHTSSEDRSAVGTSHADTAFHAWHREHPLDDATQIGAPVRDRDAVYIPVSRRLTDAGGAFAGVIVASLEPRYLESFYRSVEMGPRGRITIFRADGTVLVRAPVAENLPGTSFANTPLFRDFLPRAPQGHYRQLSPADGTALMGSYASLPAAGLVVAAAYAEDDLLAGWRREALTEAAMAGVLVLVLLALAATLARRLRMEHALGGRLAKSERQFRALVETASEGIWRVDAAGILRYVNPAMVRMLGYDHPAQMLGQPKQAFVHPGDRELAAAMAAHSRVTGEPSRFEMRYRRRDGAPVPTITSVSVHGAGEAEEWFGMATGIGERLAAEDEIRRSIARLEALRELDRAILVARTREEVAEAGLAQVRAQVPSRSAVVVVFDHAAGRAEVIGLSRGDETDPGPRHAYTLDQYGREEIALLSGGEPLLVNDLAALPSPSFREARLRAAGLASFMSIPLLLDGTLVGALTVSRETAGRFGIGEIAVAREIADRMAIALREVALRGQLERSEAESRRMLQTAREGIWRIDRARVVRYANPALVAMLGYGDAAEVVGRKTADFIHPDDLARAAGVVRKSRETGEPVRFESRLIRKDGSLVPIIASLSMLEGATPEGQELLGMLTDISERVAVEEEVRRNLARLEGLHLLDRGILEARTRVEIAQAGLTHLRGLVHFWGGVVFSFDHAAGRATAVGFDAGDGNDAEAPLSISFDEYGRDEMARLAAGERIMVADVEALAELSPRLRRFCAMGMRAYLSVPLLASGELVGVLSLGRTVTGPYSEEDTAVAQEVASQIAVALRQAALREAVQRHAGELEARVEQRTRELAAANAELKRANEELASFSSAVSHDLRAPARHVAGFVSLLREDLGGIDANAAKMLDRIEGSARRMMALIDDLLLLADTSRRQMRMAEVDLGVLAHNVKEEIASAPGARPVEWVISELPKVHGDAALLRVVLVNLMGNAVKYSSRSEAPRVEIGARPTLGGMPEIFVRDNGAGFDMARAGRLFTPFTRLHSAEEFEGTGIGLATVKRIVERHGGHVRAEGSPGAGAKFSFTLNPAD